MKNNKYYFNKGTGMLHKINGCYHSRYKQVPPNGKEYQTEDDAIAENTKYMNYCKICFKHQDID